MTDDEFIRNVFITAGVPQLEDTPDNRVTALHAIHVAYQAFIKGILESSPKVPWDSRPTEEEIVADVKRDVVEAARVTPVSPFVLDPSDETWMNEFTKRTGAAIEVFDVRGGRWCAQMRDAPDEEVLFEHVVLTARDALKALRKDAERWEEDRPR